MRRLTIATCIALGLGWCSAVAETEPKTPTEPKDVADRRKEFTVENDYLIMPIQNKSRKFKGAHLPPVGNTIELRVLVDRAIMEIIGNGGRVYISAAGPGPKMDVDGISVSAIGGHARIVEFQAHELKSICK